MLFSYNLLQEFIKTALPAPEKLADLLILHAFEVDAVEKKGSDAFLDVAILPQRGDCLSHEGLAREIAAITQKQFVEQEKTAVSVQKDSLALLKVLIPAKSFVQRYSAIVLENVAVGPSPQWIQERLASLGVNSINNVVDVTNLVMFEMGQPLHAFDYNKIKGGALTLRGAKAGERIVLLDETELTLPKGTLVIQDSDDLIDLAGIKGGKRCAISKHTKHIILQAVVFDRKKIYQTKKTIGYSTNAAELYAHGVAPYGTERALERALFLLSKSGGGKVVQHIDIYPAKKVQAQVEYSGSLIERMLGIKIPDAQAKSILSRLGFMVKGAKAQVPWWRQDIEIPQDIVEEIGRIYGYEAIEEKFPEATLLPPPQNIELSWQELLRTTLKEAGFSEVYNYSFVAKKEEHAVELENPISQDFAYLRTNLIDSLLCNVETNKRAFQTVKMFEIGNVFTQLPSGISEELRLGAVLKLAQGGNSAFYEMKGVLDLLFSRLGIGEVWYTEHEKIKKSAAIVISQNKNVGVLKEIEPQFVACEISLPKVFEDALEEREYQPPSKFPAVLRDIALLVPFEAKVEDVRKCIETAGGELIAGIDLFDMYEGEELPNGKKSLAFHLVYQAQDRTLTNREVDALQEKIIKALEENEGWEVRA